MAEIFNNRPGIVAVLNTNATDDNPFRVTIDGFPTGDQGAVIITELAIQRAGNYQFLHTLKDLIYVYSFGERIGQIRASGLAFARLCNGVQGLESTLAYYEINRLENRADPISIVIGTSGAGRFRGFLTEVNLDVSRPDARMAQFGMQFHAMPSASANSGIGALGNSGGPPPGYYTPAPRRPTAPLIPITDGPNAPASGGMDGTPGGMGSGVSGGFS
jgi:hypothetical protein